MLSKNIIITTTTSSPHMFLRQTNNFEVYNRGKYIRQETINLKTDWNELKQCPFLNVHLLRSSLIFDRINNTKQEKKERKRERRRRNR
jgi:hypothetical protein